MELRQWRDRGFILFNGNRLNISLLEDLESLDIAACARKVLCPVLVLHGDADSIVPVAEAYELHNCLRNSKRLTILPGADHRFSKPEAMRGAIDEAIDWLTQHVE